MLQYVQMCLTWMLTFEVVGILSGILVGLGMPAQLAPMLILITGLFVIWKVMELANDRFMIQRWKRKYYGWTQRR